MKKIVLSIMILILIVSGCNKKTSFEYDEETVKEETLQYLEDKYGGSYQYQSIHHPYNTNWVNVSFKDLEKSNDKESTFIKVKWYRESGASSDSTYYIEKGMDYDEDVVKKEALKYLEKKYDEKFEFWWCTAHSDYVDVVFEVADKTKQNTVTVKWKSDGTMTDNFEE